MYDYKEHGKSIVPLLLRSDLVSDLFASSCFEIDREYNSDDDQDKNDSDEINENEDGLDYRIELAGISTLFQLIDVEPRSVHHQTRF